MILRTDFYHFLQKNTTKIPREHTWREEKIPREKKNKNGSGRRKKSAKFWAPHPSAPHFFSGFRPHPLIPHPSNPLPSDPSGPLAFRPSNLGPISSPNPSPPLFTLENALPHTPHHTTQPFARGFVKDCPSRIGQSRARFSGSLIYRPDKEGKVEGNAEVSIQTTEDGSYEGVVRHAFGGVSLSKAKVRGSPHTRMSTMMGSAVDFTGVCKSRFIRFGTPMGGLITIFVRMITTNQKKVGYAA